MSLPIFGIETKQNCKHCISGFYEYLQKTGSVECQSCGNIQIMRPMDLGDESKKTEFQCEGEINDTVGRMDAHDVIVFLDPIQEKRDPKLEELENKYNYCKRVIEKLMRGKQMGQIDVKEIDQIKYRFQLLISNLIQQQKDKRKITVDQIEKIAVVSCYVIYCQIQAIINSKDRKEVLNTIVKYFNRSKSIEQQIPLIEYEKYHDNILQLNYQLKKPAQEEVMLLMLKNFETDYKENTKETNKKQYAFDQSEIQKLYFLKNHLKILKDSKEDTNAGCYVTLFLKHHPKFLNIPEEKITQLIRGEDDNIVKEKTILQNYKDLTKDNEKIFKVIQECNKNLPEEPQLVCTLKNNQ